MKILIAVLLPPLAVLLCGRVVLAIVLLVLQITMIGWIPAAIVAAYVVSQNDAEKRVERLAAAMGRTNANK